MRRVKNPLFKRYLRALIADAGKYIALFLFIAIFIGFTSGYMVANHSIVTAFDESFEQYNIEDGHFILRREADDALMEFVTSQGVTLYDFNYKDKEVGEDTIRIYPNREEVNLPCVMDGRLAKEDDEIVIDRLYGENNDVTIGDVMEIDGRPYTVTGLVALSDYSALFKSNTDMMFNASLFCVGLVTREGYEALDDKGLVHCTVYKFNDPPADDEEGWERSNDLAADLDDYIDKRKDMRDDDLIEFVSSQDNQAIRFTQEDFGADMTMMEMLLVIVMAVLAFIFAVTTQSDIEREAGAIGTLRASGYTRTEMLLHYMFLPLFITVIGAAVGNIAGYTRMKEMMAGLYYHSYSLPTYVTRWSTKAFLQTTLLPCAIVFVVSLLVLFRMLRLPPLKFLRRDLRTQKQVHDLSLEHGGFLTRFRIRILIQNRASYLVLAFGIFLAVVLLMFGLMFGPVLTRFRGVIIDSMICERQYVLKEEIETADADAEKYCMYALKKEDDEVSVYGIEEDSRYLTGIELPDVLNAVTISSACRDKYGLKTGDRLRLKVRYGSRSFDFIVAGVYDYESTVAIYMKRELFNRVFFLEQEYFTGYFSDRILEDIPEEQVQSIITEADMTTIADQMMDSLGSVMGLFSYFAMAIFAIVVYILAKLIVDRNSHAISMLKILGYTNGEVGRLYNTATAIVVVVSLVASLPFARIAIKSLLGMFMERMNGYLPFYIAPWIYLFIPAVGIVLYALVHILQMRRVRRIPMSEALKNVE